MKKVLLRKDFPFEFPRPGTKDKERQTCFEVDLGRQCTPVANWKAMLPKRCFGQVVHALDMAKLAMGREHGADFVHSVSGARQSLVVSLDSVPLFRLRSVCVSDLEDDRLWDGAGVISIQVFRQRIELLARGKAKPEKVFVALYSKVRAVIDPLVED